MKLRNRFLLVGLGIVIFLIVTPVLILYARGFQIDWKTKTFVKTGALVVKTEPTKAEIFLNDQKQDSVTPANIRFLHEGDYNLRVEKESYQSWTKRLSIKSQLVTWANFNRDYITLFLKQPSLTQTWPLLDATISRTEDEIIYLTADDIRVIEVNTAEDRLLSKIQSLNSIFHKNTELKWKNAKQVNDLFASTSKWNLTPTQTAKNNHMEVGNDHIIALIDTSLYSLQSGNAVLLDQEVSGFTLDGDDVWYIRKNELKHYNFSTNNYEVVFSTLPLNSRSKIVRTENQIYVIIGGILYVLNDKLEKIYSPVAEAIWYSNSNQLLFTNNNEIYTYNPNEKNSTLVLRSISPIKNSVINMQTGYIFYQNEGKIKAIELDDRDHRNIFTITDDADDFALSNDGKKLYTVSKTEIKYYLIR